MIRNLGQVAAIYIGSSAPRNTNLIWLDNTVVPFVFRAYDGSAWSEIATHKWVRAYVDGWLVTLPPRQLADDGDYMLINSNNVNYKITVKDFVKSAVGNPLDFKGIIRVSADFPNPSTLESGDMYVIITSPAGGTVTDPYSGKTFEDSEKIVWDEVTQSWESLGKIDITVDLTTSYSETEVTIHSSAGKETTIQGATDQLAGVMLPGQYSWLQALSNGSIVPGDPSPLTPLTPAHKHNYNDIINRLVSQQGTGESTIDPMSQKATTDALNLKFDKASVLQVSGAATDKVMSQKAVTDALKTLSDDFNNKLTNYLPLSGGTMTGSIIFPNRKGIFGTLTNGTSNIKIAVVNANNNVEIGNSNTPLMLVSNSTDLTHYRDNNTYKIWDAYNLPDPARLGVNQTFTGLNTFTKKTIIGDAVSPQILLDPANQIRYRYAAPEVSRGYTIALGNNNNIREFTFGGYYSASKNEEYAYLSLPGQAWDASTYKFYANSLKVPYQWSIDGPDGNAIIWSQTSEIVNLGRAVGTTKIRSGNTDLIHTKGSTEYIIWDKSNLPTPATSTDLANYLPLAGGTLTGQAIFNSYGLAFNNNTWSNDLVPNRNYSGYLQVLDAYDASSAGGPTNYGTVLQVNSRNAHWANQLWFPGGAEASKNGLYYRHMAYNQTEYGEWNRLLTNKDVNILSASYNNNPNSLPTNQIFYAETQGVAGTPTSSGLLFSVQGDDEGIQLWAGANRTELYYRTKWTSFGNWIELATTSDLGNYLPLSGGTISSSKSNPLTINSTHVSQSSIDFSRGGVNKGTVGFYESLGSFLQNATGETLAVKSDGAYYGVNINSLRKLATITDLNNYLPLTGGALSGTLTIDTIGSNPFVINNNDTNGSETYMRVLRKGTASAAIGFMDSLGAYIYNYNSNKYLFIDNDGYARVGTTSGSTRLALITDIPTVSGYLPLSGGTLTGALTMSRRSLGVVIDVIGGAGNSWNEGAGALSIQVPNDAGQTPLILARRSGAAINTTVATERLLSMELLDTGHSFIIGMSGSKALQLDWTSGKAGTGKLFGKTIATTDQIPSIPSISISNSGSGNAVTSITASGHTLTVTKGATYLTSSSLDGYATQTWANGQFAPLSRFNTSTGYTTIKVTGQEFNFDSTSSEIYMNYRTLSGSPAVTKIIWRAGGGPSSTALCEGRWGNLYMNNNLVATQSWAAEKFPNKTGAGASGTWGISISGNAATATNATQLGGTAASSYVKANDNISRLTNDSGYTTQEWVNSQNFVKSTSTKKVTDIQPVDALPATQASGVLYLVFG